MKDSSENIQVRGWIEQLKAFDEKGYLEGSDYEDVDEIERGLNELESAYGGIGDTLDHNIQRAKKILIRVQRDNGLYVEEDEWENIFPDHDEDDDYVI